MSASAKHLSFVFDAIELRWYDPEDADAQACVFLHPVEGGSFAIADCGSVDDARMVGEALAAKFNVPLHDFL